MHYISAKEAGQKWNISQCRVSTLCVEERIEGCTRVGNMWLIPSSTAKPQDARHVTKVSTPTTQAKPFVKWAGGKGQLLGEISKYYPHDLGTSLTKYVEPFIGGGAVLFDILSKYNLTEVHINDINKDLINLYTIIKNDVNALIDILNEFQKEYIVSNDIVRKDIYTQKRTNFNTLKINEDFHSIEKAALFVFLNKTCFNGLYRVNKKGLYNVPMGAYKNPCICDIQNLMKVSQALKNVTIHYGSYLELDTVIDKDTFVYVDPPYRPLNATSSFTSYSEFDFNDEKQKELAEFATRISQKNAKILLSNSDPKNTDEQDNFFDEIYKDFTIKRVYASRMINSKGGSRGKISELLISNF